MTRHQRANGKRQNIQERKKPQLKKRGTIWPPVTSKKTSRTWIQKVNQLTNNSHHRTAPKYSNIHLFISLNIILRQE